MITSANAPTQSDTPRTDANIGYYFGIGWWIRADFARTLERELTAAHQQIAAL